MAAYHTLIWVVIMTLATAGFIALTTYGGIGYHNVRALKSDVNTCEYARDALCALRLRTCVVCRVNCTEACDFADCDTKTALCRGVYATMADYRPDQGEAIVMLVIGVVFALLGVAGTVISCGAAIDRYTARV
jgi:hypothetical protein